MQRLKHRILIIAILPPPIGGVSIHIRRLLDNLEASEIEASFVKTHHLLKWYSIKALFKHKNIHVHSSNSYIRFALALVCLLLNKNSFLTYHGNLGRYNRIRNLADSIAIRLYRCPIVINQLSYRKAIKLNKATQLASPFIRPTAFEPLPDVVQQQIFNLKSQVHTVFCTNATSADIFKDGREIYQISDLIKFFGRYPHLGLIISDPSGRNEMLLKEKALKISSNIIVISTVHDFNSIIKLSDVMIRFTTTDGDSLSVKEALSQGKPVIATNVVDRPKEVYLVDDNIQSLEKLILNTTSWNHPDFREDGFDQLLQIYKKHLI